MIATPATSDGTSGLPRRTRLPAAHVPYLRAVLIARVLIARILIELAPSLAKGVRAGGTLVLGGIIDVKEAAVRDAFNEVGLTLLRREEREDWVSLVLRKPAL